MIAPADEEAAVALCESIKQQLLAIIEMNLQTMPQTPRFARYAVLEATRATMATLLRHVLSTEMEAGGSDYEHAQGICAATVTSLENIVTPRRLN